MPRLSIVIPFSGSVTLLEDTLVSVLENRPDECQIVVVLNDIYGDPYNLKDDVCFVHAPIGSDLVRCTNLGIEASRAPIVHVLTCGVEVDDGWADAALSHFDDPAVATVASLVIDIDDRERVDSSGVDYTLGGRVVRLGQNVAVSNVDDRARPILGPDVRAAFYRKSTLELVGLFGKETGQWTSHVDLALTLQQLGLTCVLDPKSRVYASASAGPQANAFCQSLEMERLFWRWVPRTSWTRALFLHPLVLMGECCRSFPRPAMIARILGRLLGTFRIGSHRRHFNRLERLKRAMQHTRPVIDGPHFKLAKQRESKTRRDAPRIAH